MYYDKKIGGRMLESKRLDFSLDIKMLDESGRFAGYASVFDVVDNQRDVILHGAFAKTLLGRIPSIKLLWQLVAFPLVIRPQGIGLMKRPVFAI